MKRPKSRDDHPLLHTVEEATVLLRCCPVRAWFWWFAGTAPFVCCSLHFWSDMSRAADARLHLAAAAFYLALSYGFMKVMQAVFGDHLMRLLRGEEDAAPLPLRGKLRLVTSQLLLHSATWWVLTVASVAVLPFGWAYAFFHNANLLALQVFRGGGRTRDLYKLALAQCHYRPGQNHGLMSVLLVFSLLVWLNIVLAVAMVLMLMKTFTGAENLFTRNPALFASAGFLAATMSVAYFIAGPFVKACYAVRCFYGLSRKNGEDIVVRFRTASAAATAMVVLVVGSLLATPARAQSSAPPSVPAATRQQIDSSALDKNIHEVMQQDIFQWRMPRDQQGKQEKGWLESFVEDAANYLKSLVKETRDAIDAWIKEKIKQWLRGNDDGKKGGENEASTPWADTVQWVLYLLLAALVIVLTVLLYRQWRKRPPPTVTAADAAPEVDLKSEDVLASQLAENEWLKLAQEKMDAGEYRLALRALFLATLAHLGERRMIAIVKSKSNGDYVRELGFRARGRTDLNGWFRQQSSEFDRVWYGWHDVTRDLLEQFRANHQRIVSDGPA